LKFKTSEKSWPITGRKRQIEKGREKDKENEREREREKESEGGTAAGPGQKYTLADLKFRYRRLSHRN